ncbi:MAG: hypothetical protein APF81_19720 [Desulfosporosinus sp. BRH_c37]|nr:MAG: hypothetical protein APF81_19720 [Desulfosporosinus sp. BRH_c37]
MPLRALRPCKQAGCPMLTRDANGYCDQHKPLASSQHMEYKRGRTDKREQAFYNSGAWRKARGAALRRDHGLCQHCLRAGKITAAVMVHHLTEIKVNWLLRLDLGNLVSLCDRCHNKIPPTRRKL